MKEFNTLIAPGAAPYADRYSDIAKLAHALVAVEQEQRAQDKPFIFPTPTAVRYP